MRTDLLHQAGDPHVTQLCLLFAQQALPKDCAAHKAKALDKQIHDDPQHEKRRVMHGMGACKKQHVHAEHYQERKTPKQFPLRGLLLKQHNQMQDGCKHAVRDKNAVQLNAVHKLQKDKDERPGQCSVIADKTCPEAAVVPKKDQETR